MADQRGERRSPGGYRTSVLGRVDWSCWLAAVGLLFLTVVSVLVQFAILGVITAILAVGLVAFDSWINRPKGFRAQRADTGRQTGGARSTGWRGNSAVNRARPSAQNFRRPTTVGQPQRRQPPPPPRQPNGQPPRQPIGQPPRQPPGQQRQQPSRQPPPAGQPPLGQSPQGQPPRPPFRPSPPDPGRARR